jgi:hypothetical protein
MGVEEKMYMTLNQANATEHLLKTFDRLGMMSPYLVMGHLMNEEEDGYPVYKVVVRIVGQKKIYVIEVGDEDDYAR